ncbi:MAG: hypothetical protein GX491_19205 [Chloroflexi bacterium]|nr:hypothetical protein [Chloroflexota bacterium]
MSERPTSILTGASSETVDARIREMFAQARRALIVSHIRPDGDAIGSVLGLGLALEAAGKDVRMALADGLPANFNFLTGAKKVHRSVPSGWLAPDASPKTLVITVDCADLGRTGGLLGDRVPDLNIDHHVTNLNFAGVNLVVPDSVSTTAIIAGRLPAWGLPMTPPVASALLTGLVTDTIGFRTSNISPEALRLAADLMEAGAPLPELYTRALVSKSYEAALYWGQGLAKTQREALDGDGVLVWTNLTLEDRQKAQYPGNDDADLVNMLSSIEGDVAVIFVEQKNGHTKVSWRARPGFDVSKIALQFGGGGHAAAAGADIPGSLEEVQEQVLKATRSALANIRR